MNSSSGQTAPKVEIVEEKAAPSAAMTTTFGIIAIIPILFTLVFHAGAAYLSYQRSQSLGWAILHFFLAVFYYPYYAFTQGGSSSSAPAVETSSILPPAVQTAGRRLKKMLSKRK